MADDSTTKIKMDISELKKSMTEARRQIRLANAEFKASSAGMDNWAKSADGLSAKMNQLRSTLSAEKSILNDLNKQYELTVQSQGKNSKGAQELLIKIKNQEAAINKTKASLEKYGRMMSDLERESSQAANSANELKTAYERLESTISKQESDLQSLKAQYSSVVMEQGKTSDEAQKLANEISKLSSELVQNKSKMESASNAADELDKSMDKAADAAEESADGFTVLKGTIANLLADGIKGTIEALKNFGSESDQAYNKFQAQTGASAQEMQSFKTEMNDLYKNNFGESLQDVGDKMAYIKQVTGETDPSKIKELAENAISLEDTFDSDFSETVRGVSNLMTHFGIDSTEAFDLFAKGSQEGLDYTDELGDNIAEYGGNFKQAGYSATEYFQLLKNGTKNGAYNLDKVNDSINEVKNRLGDGTIGKDIDMFSKNTKTAFKAWESGKGTMKDVIESIVKDINKCTDEQKALTMAQTAFGTMGEDANLKVVKSLTATGDTFKDVKGTMEELKDVRYDDINSQFAEIGRSVQVDLIQPLAQKALPDVKSFVKFVIENINSILPATAAVGAGIGTMFAAQKLMSFIQTLQKTAVMFGVVSAATDVATGSELAFNAAMLANPVTLAVAGITALTAGIAAYVVKTKLSSSATDQNTKSTNELISKQKELKKALSDSDKARQSNISNAQEEGSQADIYYDRLNKLIGVEKKSSAQKALIRDYVQKLNDLMPDLNLKYDEEKDKLNKSTSAIEANIKAQKELILAKAAQSNLQTIAEDIVKLETQQGNLVKQNTKNEEAYKAAQNKTQKAKEAYLKTGSNQYSQEYHNYVKAIQNESEKRQAYEKTSEAVDKNKKKLAELNGEYDKTEKYAQSKINVAEIDKSLSAIAEKMKAKGKKIPQAVSDGIKEGQYEVPKTVEGMENLIKFDKLAKQAKVDGVKIPKNLAEGISSGKVSAQTAVDALKQVAKFDDSKTVADAKQAGIKIPKSLREGIASGQVSVQEATKQLQSAIDFGSSDVVTKAKNAGIKIPASLANGIASGKVSVKTATDQVQTALDFKSSLEKAGITGKQIPQSLMTGIVTGKTSVKSAAKIVNDAITFKDAAKEAGKDGTKTVTELVNKILAGKISAEQAGKELAKATSKGQKDGSTDSKNNGQKSAQEYNSGVKSQSGNSKKAGSSVGKSSTTGMKSGSKGAGLTGQSAGKSYSSGVGSQSGKAKSSGQKVGKSADSGAKAGGKGAKSTGQKFGSTYAGGVSSKGDSAKSSGTSLANNAKSGAGSVSAHSSGTNFAQGFINGIASLFTAAWNAGKKLATSGHSGLKKGQKEGSPSKLTRQSGVYFGEGYNNGIKSMIKTVAKSGANLAITAYGSLRTAQKEGSPSKLTYDSGKNFTKGFINGISNEEKNLVKIVKNMVTTVVNVMANMSNFDFSGVATNASNAFSDALSKQITYMQDKMQYQSDQKSQQLESKLSGYENSRDDYQKKYDTAKSKYDKMQTDYKKAEENYNKAKKNFDKAKKAKDKKKYKSQMDTYKKQMNADKKTMKSQDKNMSAAKKQISNYESLVKEQTEFNNSYQEASSKMLSEFSNALSEYQTKAQDLIDTTINGITDTYQAKYDALIEKQDTLISKLKSAGDLFEVSNAGIMTVNDIKEQTQSIRDYTSKLQTIKSKVSSELFDQIASYDMDQGSAFMDRLLAMSDADLKAYSDAYDEKMRFSEESAKKIYSKDFDNVASDYKNSLQQAFKDLPGELETIGQQVMAGFTTGLTKDTDYMTSAIKTMVQAMVDQFKSDLDIHSPSKVTEGLGNFTGQGFGNGLLESIKRVQQNARQFINSVTSPIGDYTTDIGNVRRTVGANNNRGSAPVTQTVVNNYNLVQNNTSPKSLSALDTYRARRQQVNMLKAMTT
jgi:phage-related minor tail protein